MRMARRGLLRVFIMVLIYNASPCNADFNNKLDAIVRSSTVNVANGTDDFAEAGVKILAEQTEISRTQTTRSWSDVVIADRQSDCVPSARRNDEFQLQTNVIKQFQNPNSHWIEPEKNLILGKVANLSLRIKTGAELNSSKEQRGTTSVQKQGNIIETTPLQFTYGFGINDRLRRYVFGRDTRVHIESVLTQVFPFSAVVRLGSGCTGTLIWHKHVLTAAHCVHDGNKYRPPLWKLKVGILRRSGTFKWLKVKKAFVARAWIRKEGLGKVAHDYAVLELDKPHGRPYMTFGWHPTKETRPIQFSGFPADKPVHEIWFSLCTVKRRSKNILYNHCDAYPGMSGSGVYIYDKNMPAWSRDKKKSNRKVVAIFSTFVEWRRKDGKIRTASNTATRLTPKKVEKICHWIKAGKGCKLLRKS